jgi:UDPglucose--hexose-1-phosphate uridylyltransferase
LSKRRIVKADGRYLIFYSSGRPQRPPARSGAATSAGKAAEPSLAASGALELRWNPLLDEWVIVATERQERTFLPPAEYCPFCPTRDPGLPTEVPAPDYEIVVFENRFPSLRRDAPPPPQLSLSYRSAPARGGCEVVLYSPRHEATLAGMPVAHIRRLVEVWTDRYEELGKRRDVDYVFIFENRGPEIGVTLTHPHGQIYAFPYLPPRVERELSAAERHQQQTGACLFCEVMAQELESGERLVAQNEAFVAFVPYFARLPYEVHILSRRHRTSLADLTGGERGQLARILKTVLLKYDNLWDLPMPFAMVMHQQPTDGRQHPGCHFHVEFTPIYRSPGRLKYQAGCETGAGTFINDTLPEKKAEELRWAEPRT